MFDFEGLQIPAIPLTHLLTNMFTAYTTLLLLSDLDTAFAILLLPDEQAWASITFFVLSHPFTTSTLRVLTRPLTTSMLLYNLVPIVIGVCVGVIFHISKRKERKNYIRSSFAASGTASQRMVTWLESWSGSANRARPLGIRFHPEWQHPDCAVMRWYNDQGASSRKFRTVEHRRDIHGPFYHEFLLLKLTDGAVCRLERVGEGSRADAIRYIGCTANDLIQWFTRNDYAELESEHPSALISEVSFPFEYDILDVLAACYSIQNTKACSVYTLQRYNCYFLCLTVLAVLTRRAASWENEITDQVWDSALDYELARLSSLPAQEMRETPMLRLYAMLEPNNPHCSKPLLEGLHSTLYSGSSLAGATRGAVRSSLWLFPGEPQTPIETIASLVSRLVAREMPSATRLRSILRNSLEDSGQPPASSKAAAEFCTEVLRERMRDTIFDHSQLFSNLCQMMEIERPTKFRTMVLSRMVQFGFVVLAIVFGPDAGLGFSMDVIGIGTKTSYPKLSIRLNLAKLYAGFVGYGIATTVIGDDRYDKLIVESFESALRNGYLPVATSVLNTLESKGMLEQEADVKHVFAIMLQWPQYALEQHFVFLTLVSILKIIFQGSKHISMKTWDNSTAVPEITRILEFQQQYIQPRIHAHAERVALHRLAAAPLVSGDIQNTMAAVWKSLPPGFDGANPINSRVSSR